MQRHAKCKQKSVFWVLESRWDYKFQNSVEYRLIDIFLTRARAMRYASEELEGKVVNLVWQNDDGYWYGSWDPQKEFVFFHGEGSIGLRLSPWIVDMES